MYISKYQIEKLINETIAVIYQLVDNKRIAVKCDNNKDYYIQFNKKYLIISAKHFYKIENLKLKQIHPFE